MNINLIIILYYDTVHTYKQIYYHINRCAFTSCACIYKDYFSNKENSQHNWNIMLYQTLL